jgi:hypothetical protein
MSDTEKSLFIGCNRFGGTRCALSCAHYDRYRGCRKTCKTLEEFMKSAVEDGTPDLETMVKDYHKDKPPSSMPSKHSCKGLPLQEFKCKYCKFVAKSGRGLKKHMTMSHKMIYR